MKCLKQFLFRYRVAHLPMLFITCFCLLSELGARTVSYDAAGRVIYEIQLNGQMTTFAYDENSNLTAIGSISPGEDSDLDSIPDFFEIHYSGTSTGLAPDGDEDDDSITNIVEFAFARNPTISDGFDITPISIVPPTGSNRYATITYHRPQVAPSLITYQNEVSFDLMSWSSSPADVAVISVTPLPGGVEEVIVRALTPIDTNDARIFLRVKLITP